MRTRREVLQSAWDSDDDRGAVLYLVLLFLFIFVAVAAVSVDLAALGARGQDLQNTSDAAALAGIVAYQDEILAGGSPAQAEAAAIAVVNAVIRQNGIDPDDNTILVDVDVVNEGAQFTVTIGDTDPNQFLPTAILDSSRGDVEDIKSEDVDIARSATAEFLLCEDDCSITVNIPAPFQAVSARGNGDGYKPIAVGTRLYALNHNSGNRRIVCVDRLTQAACWGTEENPVVFRNAYNDYDDRNPEMPHTAVVGTRIYWSATDTFNGLRLFCWETITDIPCGSRILDSTLQRIDENDYISRPFYGRGNDIESQLISDKDENRGSGTVAVGDKVFVFTDNHRVHCYAPAIDDVCGGFPIGGSPTALDVFPPQNPWIGNHGSSIDRIVDETTGYIYSTLHIPNAVSCSSPLPSPNGLRVVVVNEETGRYLASPDTDVVYSAEDGRSAEAWWDVAQAGPDEAVSFQSVNHGEYLDGDFFVGTSSALGSDDEWNSFRDNPEDTGYRITNVEVGGSLRDDIFAIGRDNDIPVVDNESRWNYYPWQCGDPALLGAPTPSYYKSGTWLHCFNTATVSGLVGPCPTFEVSGIRLDDGSGPAPLHLDGSRYSGRLWFYYSAGPDPVKQGICSSGFSSPYTISSFDRNDIEVTCVDIGTGNFNSTQTSNMADVRNVIVSYTGNDKDPDEDLGAWGDPHWNPQENRLFYPTEHNSPRIICYDFDTGPCDTFDFTGEIPPNPSGLTDTEDYGFVSDGNCVFALGHNAFFWAFRASDSGQRCQTQPFPTRIDRCPCAGTDNYSWGELDFTEIDLDRFTEFGIRVVTTNTPAKLPIFPGDGSVYYIKGPGVPSDVGKILNLDAMQIDDARESIYVEIYVEGVGDEEIGEIGDFDIRFPQRPRLIE